MPRILVADDQGLYRKGLQNTLLSAIQGVEIREADRLLSVLDQLKSDEKFDLVLIALSMGGFVSFASLRTMRKCSPQTRFLVLASSDARTEVLGTLASGLHGFVSKLQQDHEIIAAVVHVLNGGIYVPPWIAQVDPLPANPAQVTSLSTELPFTRLTPRQKDILPLLAKGLSNKEIARALSITEATTKIHVAALCRVIGARNRTEAAWATRGFLDKNQAILRLDSKQAALFAPLVPDAAPTPR
jgi:DNA-binding NarL/FixJ family response regulator